MAGSQSLEGKYHLERIQWNTSSAPLCPVCPGHCSSVRHMDAVPSSHSTLGANLQPQACARSRSKLFSHENKLSFWTPLRSKGSTWTPLHQNSQRGKPHLHPLLSAISLPQLLFPSPVHGSRLITYLQFNPVFYLPSLQCLYVMSKFVVKRHNIQLLDKVQFFCYLLSSSKYDKC